VSILCPPVVNTTDPDILPYPYTEPVVFYACYKAKNYARRWDESEQFLAQAVREVNEIEGVRAGLAPVMPKVPLGATS